MQKNKIRLHISLNFVRVLACGNRQHLNTYTYIHIYKKCLDMVFFAAFIFLAKTEKQRKLTKEKKQYFATIIFL